MEKKTKNNLKYIIIILIVIVLIGIVFFIVWNGRNNKIQKLTSFDITVSSYLNSMPATSSNEGNNRRKAYFAFTLVGIEKDEFLNEYEIKSINLNGTTINNEEITYDNDDNGFRFYSSEYKENNNINLIIRNKNTNIEYSKKLKVSTKTVF